MGKFFIGVGEEVIYNCKKSVIKRIIDLSTITIEESDTNIVRTVNISDISPFERVINKNYEHEIQILSKEKLEIAQNRFNIISPLLNIKNKQELIKEISKENKISIPTLYRWIKTYYESGLVSSLAGIVRSGGKGKSRLKKEQDIILNEVIEKIYLNNNRVSIKKTIRKVEQRCFDENVEFPHPNTIRNRINNLSEELKMRKREGAKDANYKYEAIKGNFPGAEFPLSVVQIDHTPVDIILVDEHYRKPYKRPWLTLAIDVYSRMVLGYYLSYDTPGSLGTGMCISNAILPKDNWLNKINVKGNWPCWGIMNTIHLDNAKEFRGNMVKKACLKYGINIEWRPPGTPHYGGHIERILGTFANEIHDLPGTTFSNIKERRNYDSEGNASFTLSEFEQWLAEYIVNIYHLKIHSSIEMSPLQKFNEGIFGNEEIPGIGLPEKVTNERRLKLDFMPFYERSIQEYGIVIDHIYYYDGVLRKYIHQLSEDRKTKYKFIFRRDPRDISLVYFYDPETKDYHEVRYRNTALPAISIWEFKDVIRILNKNKIEINEDVIFNTFRNLDELEKTAIRKTQAKKKINSKKLNIQEFETHDNKIFEKIEIDEEILPFEDID